ncbi:alkaline phosphatase D family protein [Alloalcanivorax xenomutans]|uniref:alkaline phosphatase D family protein n=1 Tax=Alloalcanivorax xenomutans TaxID=1094342 RepID=UPI002930562A|nr:alkaline phosphatase D family protein [Alloalcanivorax xenomutans]WOA32233.1 alkaline phosphatase D family protein [Alloalcanivorax xenomutans]
MRRLTRRDFIRASALGMGAVVVSSGLTGCGGSSSNRNSDNGNERLVAFHHGVASGDPQTQGVILWTRVTPEDGDTSPVSVSWEVASDADFTQLVNEDSTEVRQAYDYTLKVDVQGLEPGKTYYYRFHAAGVTSPVGVTRTLPEGSVDQVTFAVLSCSNYPAGFFHVYAEAAKEAQLDAVLHLGDYLYEYATDGYDGDQAEEMGRALPENNDLEMIQLVDYRRRYALYRTDPDLQALHAKAPFIAVWDDHEIANDAWMEGAENHDPATEGDYLMRKQRALQAYFEWMPIRPFDDNDREIIYRSFHYGDLVSLHMLDTRIIGRDEQLSYTDYLTDTGLDAEAFTAAVTDPNRHLLGTTQLNWLSEALATSSATWQVLGQQVLMGRMLMPAEMLQGLLAPAPELVTLIEELTTLKGRYLQGDPTLTEEEIARITTVLPYNLDAWDGYMAEREVLLQTAKQLGKNLVVLAGDTHNAWASHLTIDGGEGKQSVGVELATASVSSPGLEYYLQLPTEAIPQAEQAITLLVDDLQYLNASQRGYLRVTFTAEETRADWRFVSTVKSSDYQVDEARGHSMTVQAGSPALTQAD